MKKYFIGVFMLLLTISVTGSGLVQGETVQIPPQSDGYITLWGDKISGEHMELGEIFFTAVEGVEITSLQLVAKSELGSDILLIFEEHPLSPVQEGILKMLPPQYPHTLYFQLDNSMTPKFVVLELSVSYTYRDPNDPHEIISIGTFVGKITPDVSMSKVVELLGASVEDLYDLVSQNATNIGALQTDVGGNSYYISANAVAIDANQGSIGQNAEAIVSVKKHVSSNTAAIDANQGSIDQHTQDISNVWHDIQIHKDNIIAVQGQADANTERIITLEGFHSSSGGGGGKGGKNK